MDSDKRKFIIDTDWGIDDIQAIFIALKFLTVTAITTVGGNVSCEKINRNVAKVLEVAKVKIPIIPGAEAPLIKGKKRLIL